MKKTILTLKPLCLLALAWMLSTPTASAQDNKGLRDSLRLAINEMEYHPDSVDLRLKKAGWNLMLEEWEKAKNEYDFILDRNPNNLAALYFRAYVNEKLHRYNFARLDYENLLAVVPSHFEAQLGLALLNHKDKHYTEAYNQINNMVGQYPDSAVVYAARAGMEKERKMLEPAEYDYSEAIRRDPQNTDYRLARAELRIEMRRFVDAREDLNQLALQGVDRATLVSLLRRLPTKNKRK